MATFLVYRHIFISGLKPLQQAVIRFRFRKMDRDLGIGSGLRLDG